LNFLNVTPRESKGADTSGKYDYQKDVSICMLLEYHMKGNDYLFIFDYHDDLVILNSEITPSEYNFFQIKGHDKGSYTLTSILKQKKLTNGLSHSILGKLYCHTIDFKSEIKSVNFITNRDFNIGYGVNDNCRNYTEICIKDLSKKELEALKTKLQKEFNISSLDSNFMKIAFLKVNNLSIKDSSGHTKGKLSEFLNSKYPGLKFNSDLIYQNILDEVKRKSKHDKVVTSLDELTKHKGIGKGYFEKMLSTIGATKNFDSLWVEITTALTNEGLKSGDIQLYRTLWKKLEVERMNPINDLLRQTISDTKNLIELNRTNYRDKTLTEIVELIKPDITNYESTISNDYLTVIILSELYD
jgi:hypothetical protein